MNRYIVKNDVNVEFNDPLIQYTFTYCTHKYIYLLYQNSTREDLKNNKNRPEIHVFDWEGNVVNIYISDQSIYNFAITDNDDYIYALGLDEELNPQIYIALLN